MKLEKSQIIEIVGITAVVLSLLFVAYETQQANRIAMVTNVTEIYSNFSSINEFTAGDAEFVGVLIKARHASDVSELSEVEIRRLNSWVRRLFNVWFPATIAYQNGMLAEETYNAVFDGAHGTLEYGGPATRSIWREFIDTYPALASTELVVFIDQRLDEYEAAKAEKTETEPH